MLSMIDLWLWVGVPVAVFFLPLLVLLEWICTRPSAWKERKEMERWEASVGITPRET